jgi:arsenite-transporting ATPase
VDTGRGWDLVVIDMPPVLETLGMLALPEQLKRYIGRLLPPERQAARALRPLLAQLAGVPMPARGLYETARRLDRELTAAQSLLESDATTLRIVVEPGDAGVGTLRAACTGAALYGLTVDAVVANRMLPAGSADPWLAELSGRQRTVLKTLHADAARTPVCELPHLGREPRGLADLTELVERARWTTPATTAATATTTTVVRAGGPDDGDADGPDDGAARPEGYDPRPVVEDRRARSGVLVWRLPLPGAERGDLHLVRRGDELLLTVHPFHRILQLPSVLRRCSVSGASLAGGVLEIRFTPDSDLWPHGSAGPPAPPAPRGVRAQAAP